MIRGRSLPAARTPSAVRAAAGMLAALTLTASGPAAASVPASVPAGGVRAPALARFEHQKITWTACATGPSDEVGQALDRAGAQCAAIKVPLDYAHPARRAITVAVSRLKATDTRHRVGAMVLNGGGPGGGSIDLPPDIRDLLGGVGARYDLIGMDPRSSGRSTPVDCHWPTSTWMRAPGNGRKGFDEVVALERGLAADCERTDGDLLPYISTRNIARDMDVLRAALGERRLSYYGASYGTYLGAVYARMFPGHVDRMVLDSAVDPGNYGARRMLADATGANEAALRDWAAWTAARDARYHLGGTPGAVLAAVNRVIAASARHPLTVGGYRVDAHVVPFVLFNGLDDDRDAASASLAGAVRVLAEAAAGWRAEPTADLADTLAFVSTGVEEAAGGSQAAIFCGDRAVDRDPDAYWRDIRAATADGQVLGPMLHDISPCAFWPTAPRERPTAVRSGVPALIVNSTGDTRTTYQDAEALHRRLTASRLLTLRGARIHAVYPRYGDACVNTVINAYFRTGSLPPTDVTCASR
ncbi:alpha/beta fold hydrolase [Streptomyces sp. HPF1205]|uniref:alpha/beta fold hydrolase n=1 Tax=Streptomyces sp. HPF1205 TaxID=2873262 RepID=UPI001CEC1EE7|nr:alpha/beta fold hydrolase [Streptomyces sp. HPF1205]